MTDKELLELAAKAVGYEPQHYSEENNSLSVIKGCTANCAFNPLTDDGDALRLAVKLGITFVCDASTNLNIPFVRAGRAITDQVAQEVIDGDKLSATRRAIVRAAAAIGEKL